MLDCFIISIGWLTSLVYFLFILLYHLLLVIYIHFIYLDALYLTIVVYSTYAYVLIALFDYYYSMLTASYQMMIFYPIFGMYTLIVPHF